MIRLTKRQVDEELRRLREGSPTIVKYAMGKPLSRGEKGYITKQRSLKDGQETARSSATKK